MSVVFSALTAEHGTGYKPGSVAEKNIVRLLMQSSETEAIFTAVKTKYTVLDSASYEMSSVLQAYQDAFTAKGDMTFKPRSIPLFHQKIDAEWTPIQLQDTYAGVLAEKGMNPKDFKISQWFQEHLIEKSKEDLENDEIFWGVYAAPTPGSPSAARTTMNGIRKIINDGITAGTINDLPLGAVPSDPATFVTYVEDFVKGIPDLHRKNMDYVFMNPTLELRYKAGMRVKYNANYAQEELTIVADTKVRIMGLTSMTGSDKIWATPKSNRIMAFKNKEQGSTFELQSDVRVLKVFNDHWRGVGFIIEEYVYTNDQDLL